MRDVTTEINSVKEVGNGIKFSMKVSAEMKSAVKVAAEMTCAMEVETEVKSFKMEVSAKIKIYKGCSNWKDLKSVI